MGLKRCDNENGGAIGTSPPLVFLAAPAFFGFAFAFDLVTLTEAGAAGSGVPSSMRLSTIGLSFCDLSEAFLFAEPSF